jgi:hypothetical protein
MELKIAFHPEISKQTPSNTSEQSTFQGRNKVVPKKIVFIIRQYRRFFFFIFSV